MARKKVGKTKTMSRLEGDYWGDLQREKQRVRKQQLEQRMAADQNKLSKAFDAVGNEFKKLEQGTKEVVYGMSEMERALMYYWNVARMDQQRIVILKPRSLGYTSMYFVPRELKRVTKAWVELEDGRKYEIELSNYTISVSNGRVNVCGNIGAEVMSQEVMVLPSEEAPSSYQRKFRKVNGGDECG